MTTHALIPAEVHDRIGVATVRSYQVTAHDICRFAQAIGDGERRVDADGLLVAPALFCQVYMFEGVPLEQLPADGSPKELDLPIPATRTVGGASEFEVLGSVREHDVITVCSKLANVVAKDGKSGPLFLLVVETEFHNQHGALVARETATYVKR